MSYNQNYGGNNCQNKNYRKDNKIQIISRSLSVEFKNPEDIYLPHKKAYQYAEMFSNIKNHQMRKVLNGVKEARLIAEKDFKSAQKKLFMLVAMSAYNAGRFSSDKSLRILNEFMEKTISEKTITTKEDIEKFDELFTSIVAYHANMQKNNKGE